MKLLLAVILLVGAIASEALAANDAISVIDASKATKLVDNESFTRGGSTIYRQRVKVCGSNDADCVVPTASAPPGGTVGIPVWTMPTGTQTVNVSNASLTVVQGTAAAGAGAWPVAITDTSNVIVKPGDAALSAVRVNIVGGGISLSASADNAAFTPSVTGAMPIAAVRMDSPATIDNNKSGAFRMNPNRVLFNQLVFSNGSTAEDTTNNAYRMTQVTIPLGGLLTDSATVTGIHGCKKFAPISTSASGATQLVPAAVGKVAHVCGVVLMAAGTTTVTLNSADTGGACASPQPISGGFPLTAQTGLVAIGADALFNTGQNAETTNKAFCLNNSAAVAIAGWASYGYH